MNRRMFLGAALGVATTVAVVRFANEPVRAAPNPHAGDHPPDMDMLMVEPGGGWTSHLLPFAAPLPTQAAVQAQLARSRRLGLFR